jgi:hypothetical protein
MKQALVPKGHRPRKPQEIEKMLDLIDTPEITDEKLQRLLRKINCEEPMFTESDPQVKTLSSSELTNAERELIALYKSQGKDLPPDIAAKIKAMEERASRPAEDEENHGGA